MKSLLSVVLAASCLCLTPRLPAAVGFGDPQIQASPPMPVVDGNTLTLTAQAQPDSGFALYLWYKDGLSLSNGGRISGATTNKLVIKGIQKADAGAYRVQVREVLIGGGVDDPVFSDPINVAVIVRPVITAQPVAPAAAIQQDGFLSLNVGISAQSEQPLTYEWQRNNVPIDAMANPSAATANFVIPARDPMDPGTFPGVQWADGGSYRVRVTNATGVNVFSKPVNVTVASAAVLLSDLPDEFFIATKAKGKLSVLAGGTPKLNYQWSIDGVGNVLKGGNASSISIAGVPENDGKVYRVTVTNAATNEAHPAAVSGGATIRVINKLVAPTVTGSLGMDTYEKGFTFDKGTSPVLEVQASLDNTGTLVYQWQKDGRNISDTATVTGTDERQLVFGDLVWADRGVYRCIVRNEVSVVTSKTFVVGVNSPPVIVTHPAAANAAITGGKAVFAVVASGSGKLTYQWWRKGVGGGEDTPLAKATGNKLTLSKLLRNIAGDDYYCEVSNAFTATLGGGVPTPSNNANLIVYDPVKIDTHPQAPTNGVRVGNNLTLSVGVSGDTPVVFEWYLNKKTRLANGPLGSATVSGANTATLQINGMQPALQGSYSCVVRNAPVPGLVPAKYLVNLTSKAAKVVVVVPPSIAQQTSVSPASPVIEDEAVTLTVLGAGTGPLKYQWQRRFDPLAPWEDMPGKTASKLVFGKIQLEDDAYYRCRVDNVLNEPAFSNALDLDVNPIPGATITDFFPVVARTGDLVRVRGTNMQYVRSALIGTASAPVVNETNTSVLLTVPAGVTLNAAVLIKLQTKRVLTQSVGSFTRKDVAANDSPAEATILTGRSVTYSGSSTGFSVSPGFPDTNADATAWFWWRAPSTETFRIGVNATFDSTLSRHGGDITNPSFVSGINIIAATGEILSFAAVQGQDYYFVVAGSSLGGLATSGAFTFELRAATGGTGTAPEPVAAAFVDTPPPADYQPYEPASASFDYRLGGTDPQGSEAHTLTGLSLGPDAEGDRVTAHFTLSLELPEDGVSSDGFAWTLFGADETPLAGLWIDAADGRVSISDAAGGYEPTDVVLHPDTPYEVEIWIDRAAGTWSAYVDGVQLAEPAALPAGSPFHELAPVWQPSSDGSPHAAMSFRGLRLEVH